MIDLLLSDCRYVNKISINLVRFLIERLPANIKEMTSDEYGLVLMFINFHFGSR